MIKIGKDIFYTKDVCVQLSIGSHATIQLCFDIKENPEYSEIFFKKYENREKFNIVSKKFEGIGNLIKTIDVGSTIMNLSLRCEYLIDKDFSERIDQAIDDVLNN